VKKIAKHAARLGTTDSSTTRKTRRAKLKRSRIVPNHHQTKPVHDIARTSTLATHKHLTPLRNIVPLCLMLDEDKEEERASRGEHVAASQTMVWNEINKRIDRTAPTKSRSVSATRHDPQAPPILDLCSLVVLSFLLLPPKAILCRAIGMLLLPTCKCILACLSDCSLGRGGVARRCEVVVRRGSHTQHTLAIFPHSAGSCYAICFQLCA